MWRLISSYEQRAEQRAQQAAQQDVFQRESGREQDNLILEMPLQLLFW
jgi:hypothetical protein